MGCALAIVFQFRSIYVPTEITGHLLWAISGSPLSFRLHSKSARTILALKLNVTTTHGFIRTMRYMNERITKGFGIMNTCISRFGIRIGRRKYLNEHKPFISVSLWKGWTLMLDGGLVGPPPRKFWKFCPHMVHFIFILAKKALPFSGLSKNGNSTTELKNSTKVLLCLASVSSSDDLLYWDSGHVMEPL